MTGGEILRRYGVVYHGTVLIENETIIAPSRRHNWTINTRHSVIGYLTTVYLGSIFALTYGSFIQVQ
jgi:hypothetical protein